MPDFLSGAVTSVILFSFRPNLKHIPFGTTKYLLSFFNERHKILTRDWSSYGKFPLFDVFITPSLFFSGFSELIRFLRFLVYF